MSRADANPADEPAQGVVELIDKLSALASGFASVTDLRGLAVQVERALEHVVHVEYTGLYLWDFAEQRLRLQISVGFSEEEAAEAERTAWDRHPGRVFRERIVFHVPDTAAAPSLQTSSAKRSFLVRSRLFMPITFQDQALGAFGLASTRPNTFNEQHIAVLGFLCRLTGVVYRQVLDREERRRAQEALAATLAALQASHDELERRGAALRLARDQALIATQAKSAFLATMSHELRTPLNAILGYAELAQEDLAAAQSASADDVARIHLAATHLLGLIEDILDLSKIEAGKLELQPEPIDLKALLYSVEVTLRPLQQRSRNSLQIQLADDLPPLLTDAPSLRRVLINLLGNANKFTHAGQITLRIWDEPQHPEGPRCCFAVADTGIGITPEQLGRIFDAFTQADPSTTRKYGGTGLGLTITDQLLHLMGGGIAVTSEPGRGTTFTFWLPRPPPGSCA